MADAVPCPDPSAHAKSSHKRTLSEQASTAALYVTQGDRRADSRNKTPENVLDSDGKLSSKSAATSLKYAKATDLPSFPSTGNTSGSAGKAAMLAKDYKMKELWQPEQSTAGSKAALLAAGKGGKVDLWQASASADGQSAASLAFKNKGLSPQAYGGNTAENKNKALLAATMSVSKGRQRAESTPAPPPELYPDAANSGTNALNAATVSHRNSVMVKPDRSGGWKDEANQAARIKNSHMDPQLFTGDPDIRTDEDRHRAALKASAISMAKTMYASQDRSAMLADPEGPGADQAGARAAVRNQAISHPDVKQEALQYISLQDQAHKLAAERLAKIDKDSENARYREYYGYDDKPNRLSSRMSLRSTGAGRRKRASSEGAGNLSDTDDEDITTARRIRSQMANLGSGLQAVDAKKQQDDRARLLAAAEKRVSSRMNDMDAQVYRDTGKVSPAMMEQWEAKARERAEKEREQRASNPGKTHIGGGKFMDQSEIEAIAAARLKPTLDEINDTAEKKRTRDEDLRLEKEEQDRLRMEQKMHDQKQKEEFQRIKDEDKAAARREKEEEKARRDEQKRLAKVEKRKSRDQKRDTVAAVGAGVALGEVADKVKEDDEPVEEAPTDGREKHKSALSRLKEKFRKSGAPEEKKVEDNVRTEHAEPQLASGPITQTDYNHAQTAAAVADVAQTLDEDKEVQEAPRPIETDVKPTIAEPAPTTTIVEPEITEPVSPLTEEEKRLATVDPGTITQESEAATHKETPAIVVPATVAVTGGVAGASALASQDNDDDSLYEDNDRPHRPRFEQQPSLSGYHADEQVPTVTATAKKPNLERHISQIPESDDSGSEGDDEDWNEERLSKRTDNEVTTLPVATAPAVVAEPMISSVGAESTTNQLAGQVPLEPRGVAQLEKSPEADPPILYDGMVSSYSSRLEEQRAEPPSDLPSTLQSPGVPKEVPADALSTTAVKSVHGSPIANTPANFKAEEEKPLEPQQSAPAAAGAVAAPVVVQTEKLSEPKEVKTTAAKPEHSEKHSEKTSEDKDGEKKGLRGFFSKLRHKSKSENKQPGAFMAGESTSDTNFSKGVKYEETKAGEKPTPVAGGSTAIAEQEKAATAKPRTSGTTSTIPPVDTGDKFEVPEHVGTDGQIGSSTKVSGLSGNPEPESPSSFARHEGDLADPDDVSSSGADEDDVQRGRGGRIARKLGFGRSKEDRNKLEKSEKAKEKHRASIEEAAAAERKESSTEDDQFEEARDHFDENLAPPPAFAGQKKSESPVRETKFREEV